MITFLLQILFLYLLLGITNESELFGWFYVNITLDHQ